MAFLDRSWYGSRGLVGPGDGERERDGDDWSSDWDCDWDGEAEAEAEAGGEWEGEGEWAGAGAGAGAGEGLRWAESLSKKAERAASRSQLWLSKKKTATDLDDDEISKKASINWLSFSFASFAPSSILYTWYSWWLLGAWLLEDVRSRYLPLKSPYGVLDFNDAVLTWAILFSKDIIFKNMIYMISI